MKTFIAVLKTILASLLLVLILHTIYFNIGRLKKERRTQKPISGPFSPQESYAFMRRVFVLSLLLDKHYNDNITLITPDLDKKRNPQFNSFLQLGIRWQMLWALRYPKPIEHKNYKWRIPQKKAMRLKRMAGFREKISDTNYYVVKNRADGKELKSVGIFISQNSFLRYGEKHVFLAPIDLGD